MTTARSNTVDLLHGDCLDLLMTLDDASIDAVVTDPPYCSGGFTETQRRGAKGQGLRSRTMKHTEWFGGDNMGTQGFTFLMRGLAMAFRRLLHSAGSMLIFSDWRMANVLAPCVESAGFRYQNLVVWDKGSIGIGNGFRPQHELILHFTKTKSPTHEKSTGNVIRCPRPSSTQRQHPTEKPVELMRKLIRVVAPEGGLVLDPFMGSGSTGVAALLEGRRFIGIEREAEYVEIAKQRVEAAQC